MKKHLLILVSVFAANMSFGQVELYDNFEPTGNPDLLTVGYDGDGTYDETTVPPDATNNTSTNCVYYLRNSTASGGWDNFHYTLARKMADPGAFRTATPPASITMRVATSASIGTNIVLKFQSTTLTTDGTNHHSEYDAVTTATNNTWQTLTFVWNSGKNGSLANTEVNEIVILPAGGTNSSDQFFFDDIKGPALVAPASTNDASLLVADSKLYPNPTSGSTNVELNLKSTANVKVVLNDIMGKELKVISESNTNSVNESFDVTGLTKGIYSVTYLVDGVPAKTEKLIVK